MSTIKVNTVTTRSGSTLTLGESGKTVAIASGASTTGMGRAGAVDWQTSIKTTGFTAVSGEGYFCNTASGGFTLTLPASPNPGDIVSFSDYGQTFDTANLTVGRNGSNIAGEASDSTIDIEGIAITLVYADATKGWIVTESGLQSEAPGPKFISATGGTVTTVCTNFKVHTFTGPGTFCVSCAGNNTGSNTVDYLVVAGGGGGGAYYGAGAGGGGVRMSGGTTTGCYSVGPLGSSPSPVAAAPVTATAFPITVGAGGGFGQSGSAGPGADGSNSIFSSFTATGGGAGAGSSSTNAEGRPGGSGGGATGGPPGGAADGGNGNTPPVSPPQGNNGGPNTTQPAGIGGSGGGAGAAGTTGCAGGAGTTQGGIGIVNNINPATGDPSSGNRFYAAGGNPSQTPCGTAGAAGGGGKGPGGPPTNGAGVVNTGGGGGGNGNGGSGGSGIVVIRYKFQ